MWRDYLSSAVIYVKDQCYSVIEIVGMKASVVGGLAGNRYRRLKSARYGYASMQHRIKNQLNSASSHLGLGEFGFNLGSSEVVPR